MVSEARGTRRINVDYMATMATAVDAISYPVFELLLCPRAQVVSQDCGNAAHSSHRAPVDSRGT